MRWLKYTVNRLYVPHVSPDDEKMIVDWYNNFETSNDSSILEKINSKIYEIAGLDNEQVEYIESQIKNNGVQSGNTL